MRKFVLALVTALIFAAGSTRPAPAQLDTAPPDSGARSDSDLGRWIREAERYKEVCQQMRTGKPDASLARDRLFSDAVDRFCAVGDFTLDATQDGRCQRRVRLDAQQVSFIRSLPRVRSEPIRQIRLACVDATSDSLWFESFQASRLTLQDVWVDRVIVRHSRFPEGIHIENARIVGDLLFTNLNDTGLVRIQGTAVLNRGARRFATVVDLVNSSVQGLEIDRTWVDSGIDLEGLTVSSNLVINQTRVNGTIDLRRLTIGSGLILRQAYVAGQFLAPGVRIAGAVTVADSTITGDVNFRNAAIDRFEVATSVFGGSLNFIGATLRERLTFTTGRVVGGIREKSFVLGRMTAEFARVGGTVFVHDAMIDGTVDFDHLSADGLDVARASFGDQLSLAYARLDRRAFLLQTNLQRVFARGARVGTALIFDNSIVNGYAQFDYLTTDRLEILEKADFRGSLDVDYARIEAFRISNSQVRRNLSAQYAKFSSLVVTDSTIAPLNCDPRNCRADLFNAEIGYLRVRGGSIRELSASNARLRTLLVTRGTIERLSCEDCLIEQYALIGARLLNAASFAGAEIKGTLAFSENEERAWWGPQARLNLSELRVDVIAANACDLMLDQAEKRTEACTAAATQKGKFVPTVLTGARYRTIVPGRWLVSQSADGQPGSPPDSADGGEKAKARTVASTYSQAVALVDLPSRRIIEFIASDPDRRLIYDPQPYEEMAEALTRAGKTLEAIDLRVARINERLAKVEQNPFIRGWYWLYYYVSYYGFKNWRAFLIFLGLIAVGTVVYRFNAFDKPDDVTQDAIESRFPWLYSVWFSLDRAVPPLRLDPRLEEELRLSTGARHYFYLHRVFGTLLISVFAAGLVGLGQ